MSDILIDKSLKDFGSEYFKEGFNRPKKPKDIIYGKNHLQIGRKIKDGSIYYLDIEESFRAVILGQTRSGKSFVIRSMADRIATLNESIIHLLDVKNEMFSSIQAVQEKFRHGLLAGEKPKGLKIVTLRPTFFKQISSGRKAKSNYWYSIDSSKLSRADFMSLMNAHEMSQTQKTGMELIFQDFQKKIGANEKTQLTYSLIEQLIEDNEDIDSRQKQILKFKFKPLENSNFIEPQHTKNIVTLLKKGYIPAINLENFDSFGKGAFQYPEVTLNIALREIIIARRAKIIPRLWIFIDEASRFIGKSSNNSFKDSVISSIDLDTKYGVNFVTVWQSISDIPERIMSQSRYIFIPSTADVNTIKETLIGTGLVKNIQRSVNRAIELKRQLAKTKYSWIVLDRTESTMELITPLPPLSWHLETSK